MRLKLRPIAALLAGLFACNAYSFQTYSVGQVLGASNMNQTEVNIRDHVHGTAGVVAIDTQYNGVSTASTGAISTAATIRVTKIGRLVTVHLPSTTGNASASAFFSFGEQLAAAYWPATTQAFPCYVINNNTLATTPGYISVSVAGIISVFRDMTNANYTAASTAGLYIATSVSWYV